MLGTRWLGRYRFRLPLIASIVYLLIVGLAHGTMYLVESSDDGFVMGIQNLIIATYALTTGPQHGEFPVAAAKTSGPNDSGAVSAMPASPYRPMAWCNGE